MLISRIGKIIIKDREIKEKCYMPNKKIDRLKVFRYFKK